MVRRDVRVVRPGDPLETVHGAGDTYAMLATGEHTADDYFLTEALVPSGGGPPPHIHTREEEGFFILEGEVVIRAGGEQITATAGTYVNVPRGVKHNFTNESAAPARMLIWFAPAGFEGLFREVATNPENITAIGERYGVEYFLDE